MFWFHQASAPLGRIPRASFRLFEHLHLYSKRIRRKFAIPERHSPTKQQYAMPVSFSFKFRFGRLGGWEAGSLGREPKARRRLARRLLGKRSRWSKCVASKNSTTNVEGKQMPMSAQIMLKGFVKSAPLNKHYIHSRIRGTVSSRNIKYVSFGERTEIG